MSFPFPRVEDLFFAASGFRDAAERAAYLDEACGRGTDLRRRVEALLAAESRVGRFLESPVVASPIEFDPPVGAEGAGAVIGPYRLLEPIGEGGMGVVYLAEQDRPVRRRVALKIIKPGMDTRQVIARFEAERQALALMDHPNIARVVDGGATPWGRSYFVMELVPGVPITEFCDRERLDIRGRLELLIIVCRAVQHAHQKGIIHRDLKPSNILVTLQDGDRVPKVIDFGIAKAIGPPLTDTTLLTGCAQPIGTPRYMSPEQAEPGGLDVDTRSDIYSLGVLLYELLTGSAPFDGTCLRGATFEEVRRTLREQEPPRPSARLSGLRAGLADVAARRGAEPRRLLASVRGELDWIARKCLERERTRRYESAIGLARDLQRYLAHEPVEAGPPSMGYRLAKYVRRHRAALAVASVVSLALVAAAAISTWQAIRATGAERRMAVALEDAKRDRRLAERHLYATRLRFAGQALDSGQLDRAREILRELESEPDSFAPGEFAWRFLRSQAWGVLRPLGPVGEAGRYAVPSPDGRFLASYDLAGPIHLIDAATLRHLATLTIPGTLSLPTDVLFSADGGRLIAIEASGSAAPGRRAWVWEVPTGRLLLEFRPPRGRRTQWVTVHPGGRLVSETIPVEGGKFRADLWDIAGPGGVPRHMATLSEDCRWGQGSEDGRLFAIAEPGRIVVHDLRTGAPEHSLGTGTRDGLVWSLGFSLDGRTLMARSRARVEFWDLVRGTLAASRRLDGSVDLERIWASPDGVTVGLFRPEGLIELWDRETGRTRTIRADTIAGRREFAFHCSRDGRKLAVLSRFADRDWRPLRIWDVATGALEATCAVDGLMSYGSGFTPDRWHVVLNREPVAEIWQYERRAPESLAGHAAEAWAVAFSPDGRLLASGSDDEAGGETIKIWDAESGRLLRGWRVAPGTVAYLAFSPDGRTLASASLDSSRNVRLWDVATGRLRSTLEGHTDRVRSVAYSPDGTRLASAGSDRTVRLWDAASGQVVAAFVGHDDTVREVAFSPDGGSLASASNDRTVRLWDVATGRVVRVILANRKCSTVAFSRDGRTLAVGDEGGDIRLWDRGTGARLATIHSDHEQLFTLAFSPDGRTLAAAGSSRVIHLWDVLTGQELLSLGGHAAQINNLAFSPDGRTLASCSHDGAVKLWRSGDVLRSR